MCDTQYSGSHIKKRLGDTDTELDRQTKIITSDYQNYEQLCLDLGDNSNFTDCSDSNCGK